MEVLLLRLFFNFVSIIASIGVLIFAFNFYQEPDNLDAMAYAIIFYLISVIFIIFDWMTTKALDIIVK